MHEFDTSEVLLRVGWPTDYLEVRTPQTETSGESPHRPEAVHCSQGLKESLFQAVIASYWKVIHLIDMITSLQSYQ